MVAQCCLLKILDALCEDECLPHTPGTRDETKEEPQLQVLELSGRPWQVYSCYYQCPKPGLCPRLGDFPPAQIPLAAGHGGRLWNELPRLIKQGTKGAPA